METQNNLFWMVYGNGQGAPTAKHNSRTAAETEAKRLARNNPGIDFYVLETVSRAIKIDVQFLRLDRSRPFGREVIDDDIPF